MVVEISVDTPLCDHKHLVIAKKDGDKISVDIKTSCESIKSRTEDFEVSKSDLMAKTDDSPLKKLMMQVEPQCFVPPAIATACWLEGGLISKSLAKKVDRIGMEFEKIE